MIVETIVCDQCKRPPKRIYREYEEKVFCRLDCWLEFWTKNWQQWMDAQYRKQQQPTVFRKTA